MDDSLTLVIFGITSNLAQIKLIPALYDIAGKGLLPKKTRIIGVARSPQDKTWISTYFHYVLHSENHHHHHPISEKTFKNLETTLKYLNGHIDGPDFYQRLREELKKDGHNNTLFYLATYPDLYETIFKNLKKAGLNNQSKGWTRIMVEKPIGSDLESAKKLNKLLLEYFKEEQIFRLDHYLGKETLQNILTFRFGNGLFEHLMNKDFIDHIQITASEDFGVGQRGGYYDSVGALKDVGQNHQLQMLAFATMDAPTEFTNSAVTRERLKILQALKPLPDKLVLGQYQGYTKESKVDPNSKMDTFYALKTFINNKRFQNVPIYIRAGKKLAQSVTEINIVFKNPQNRLFKHLDFGQIPNVLVYRIQPNEGIVLKILTKKPGHHIELEPEYMQYCYKDNSQLPDAYERLIADAIRGDQTFFNDAEEVEAQWKFIDPLIARRDTPSPYKEGSWGPAAADKLIQEDGREWLEPSMQFCAI